jgi:6-phosphogluconolactonase/glucosamine-6-phosphate isomerase/deaminase
MNRLEAFDDRDASAAAAARTIEEALRKVDAGSFVATGGTTPGPAYDRLSKADLDWGRVTVTLSDERFVEASSPDSNEGLIRRRLLVVTPPPPALSRSRARGRRRAMTLARRKRAWRRCFPSPA